MFPNIFLLVNTPNFTNRSCENKPFVFTFSITTLMRDVHYLQVSMRCSVLSIRAFELLSQSKAVFASIGRYLRYRVTHISLNTIALMYNKTLQNKTPSLCGNNLFYNCFFFAGILLVNSSTNVKSNLNNCSRSVKVITLNFNAS